MGPEAREQGTIPSSLVRTHGVRGQIQKLCCGVLPNDELHIGRDSSRARQHRNLAYCGCTVVGSREK